VASGQEPEAQPDGEGDAGVVVDVQEGHVAELLAGDETKLERKINIIVRLSYCYT